MCMFFLSDYSRFSLLDVSMKAWKRASPLSGLFGSRPFLIMRLFLQASIGISNGGTRLKDLYTLRGRREFPFVARQTDPFLSVGIPGHIRGAKCRGNRSQRPFLLWLTKAHQVRMED